MPITKVLRRLFRFWQLGIGDWNLIVISLNLIAGIERMLRKDDEHWMRRALQLAGKGRGRTSPNPMVGAVLVRAGEVVGEGYHLKAGEAHAEMIAIEKASGKARNATLYTNLEPCSHFGRTPPCAPAVIKAGIKKVVVGMEDPNPQVSGKGLKALRKAGLDVEVGILETECQRLNESFCKYIVKKEPFVLLKVASTLDGKVATEQGDSKWITGETSRRFVHRLRDQVDGVLVGIGTILKDDPMLTTRIKGGKNPFRIILDSRLKISEQAKVVTEGPEKTIIATTALAPEGKKESLERKGVRVIVIDSIQERVNLKTLLSKLGEMEMISLLVEGGSEVNGSFLDQGLIDKIFLFYSPRLMGSHQAPGIFGGRGATRLEDTFPLKEFRIKRMGDDLLVEGYLRKPCSLES